MCAYLQPLICAYFHSHWYVPIFTAIVVCLFPQPFVCSWFHSPSCVPVTTVMDRCLFSQPLICACFHSHWCVPISTVFDMCLFSQPLIWAYLLSHLCVPGFTVIYVCLLLQSLTCAYFHSHWCVPIFTEYLWSVPGLSKWCDVCLFSQGLICPYLFFYRIWYVVICRVIDLSLTEWLAGADFHSVRCLFPQNGSCAPVTMIGVCLFSQLLKCCFTSTETIGLLGTEAQDGHLD